MNKLMGLFSVALTIVLGSVAGLIPEVRTMDFFMRADGAPLEQLRNKLGELTDQATNIRNRIDAEGRAMTADEQTQVDNIFAEFENVKSEIERREQIESMSAIANAGQRRVQDNVPVVDPPTEVAPQNRSQTQNRPAATPRIEVVDRTGGNHGFLRMTDFLTAIVNAGRRVGSVDPRLLRNAATTYGNEGTGADGGYAVPPDFRQTIVQKLMSESSLLSRTDQMQSSSNAITVPSDETTQWATGGIRAYWDGEAQTIAQSKPQLNEKTVRLHKMTCLVPITEELLSDAPAMASYIVGRAPEIMDFKVTDAILNGTGVGQPLGILNSAGTVELAAESGQAADTITFENLQKCYYRVRPESRRGGVWLIHPDVEEQLPFLSFPTSGGTVATPLYIPSGGASAAPFGTLFGKPIIVTEAAQALGDKGDVIFGDLKQYMSVTKIGGIRQDTSMHIYFDQDVMAFRFIFRVGGQPWRNTTVAGYRAGSNERGFFGTVAERA